MKFVLFKKSLEEKVEPIYLFAGEEEYFKERGEAMLKERCLTEPALNFSVFAGEELKGGAITSLVAAAESFPFLSARRIVKVTNFYPTEREYDAYLKKYFENPQPTTILLIVNNAIETKNKGIDWKKVPNVCFVDCSRGDEETLLRWIFTRMKRAGIQIDTECCERIMRYCLFDMTRIASETEKLIAYASDEKKISAEDVDAVVYRDSEYKVYEMSNAVGVKNYAKYLSVIGELLDKGMDEMGVLSALCAYFRSLFEIALLRKSDRETAQTLGMKEYAVKMSRRQVETWGVTRVQDCFQEIYTSINRVKSGEFSSKSALLHVNAYLFFG